MRKIFKARKEKVDKKKKRTRKKVKLKRIEETKKCRNMDGE